MRNVLLGAVIAAAVAAPFAGAQAAVLSPKCPDGYVGVVVDGHDACTNVACPPNVDLIRCPF